MLRVGLRRLLLAAGLLALSASGCLAQMVLESLPPSMGGLPADAPARPATPYKYPAVHDMPPPRADKTLSDDQQIEMLKQLENARDRQMRRAGEDPDADEQSEKPAVTKKKPSNAKKPPRAAAQAGVKPNP